MLTAPQVRGLMDGTAGYRLPPGHAGPTAPPAFLHPLWVLLATTGLREAEALGLKWESVDLDGASLRVERTLQRNDGTWQLRPPKTAKSRRTVFLPPVAVEALRNHRRRQLEWWMASSRTGVADMVFTTPRGRLIHGPNLTKQLYAVLDRLRLPRVTVHDLRHTSATILYANGVPLEAIADMLGHSTTRITADLYRHRVESIQRDAADAMQRAIS